MAGWVLPQFWLPSTATTLNHTRPLSLPAKLSCSITLSSQLVCFTGGFQKL